MTYQVRQICRGLWTYDLYEPHCPPEYSVGECRSRREAERKAMALCKAANVARVKALLAQ